MNAVRPLTLAAALVATAALAAQSPATYSPRSATPGGNGTQNSYPFGQASMEYQQIHSAWTFDRPGPLTVNGLRMTPNIVTPAVTVDLELFMARSPHGMSGTQRTFAANEVAATRVRVIDRRTVSLPATTGTWALSLPFDRPFRWDGGHLTWRLRNHGNSTGSSIRYAMESDASSTDSVRTGSFLGCTGTGGLSTYHFGILRAAGATAGSHLYARSGLVQQAAPAVVNFGLSTTSFGGVPLPFDLGLVGMPGCMLTNDVVATLPTNAPANSEGQFRLDFDLPDQPGLPGSTFHTQVAFLQPGVNALGVFLSPGATHTVPRSNGCARIYGSIGDPSPATDTHYGLVIGLDGR